MKIHLNDSLSNKILFFLFFSMIIDHRMQEVTFEEGCKDIPTLISTSQQTPSISSRRKEVIKNHLSDPNLDTQLIINIEMKNHVNVQHRYQSSQISITKTFDIPIITIKLQYDICLRLLETKTMEIIMHCVFKYQKMNTFFTELMLNVLFSKL